MMPTTGIFTMDSDGTDPAVVRIFLTEMASFPEWVVTAQQDEGAEQAVKGESTEEAISDWRELDARMPDTVVQAYVEQMNESLRGVNLHDSNTSAEENLAMYMTSTALEGLGPSGEEDVVRFLARAKYLPNIPINNADLKGIDLSGVNLSGVQGSYVNLSGANLSNVNLRGASLYGANLSYADLSGANLSGANLSTARLDGVKLTEEQLDQAGPSPAGATVPDESQERAWEAVARRALTDVAAAARSCANQHGGSYAACSDVYVLFEYGLFRMANINYQSVPEAGTNNVVFSTEHSKGGSAFQFDPAAGGRIRAVPRF